MKFLTKEVKLALTAIAATALAFIGINFLKGINVFEASNTYYVQFKNIGGLSVSNAVYANGYPVGIVRTINYDYSKTDNVIVGIELDDNMRVPVATRAELEVELMGGVKMNLVLGENPTKFMAQGDTLQGGMHVGSLNKLEAMIPTFEKMLPKLDSIMTNINRITGDSALAATLQHTAVITENMAESSAHLNKIMKNDMPELVANLKGISNNVNKMTADLSTVDLAATMQKVNSTLEKVNEFSGNLNVMTADLNNKMKSNDNTLGLFLSDRSVYDNLNSTIKSADSLMIDLKAHPKRYVHFSIFGKKDK